MAVSEDITPAYSGPATSATRRGDSIRIDLPRECPIRRAINRFVDTHDLYRFKPRLRRKGFPSDPASVKIHSLPRLGYVLTFVTLLLAVMVYATQDLAAYWPVPTGLGALTATVWIIHWWERVSKVRLEIGPDELVAHRLFFGLPIYEMFSRPRTELGDIEIEEITGGGRQFRGISDVGTRSTLHLNFDDDSVMVGSGLSRQTGEWIRDLLQGEDAEAQNAER